MSDIVERLRSGQRGFRNVSVANEAADEIERLRGLLTECGNFIVLGADEGCEPGACAECDMHRLRLRIDAALAGTAVQPERCCLDYPRCDCNSPPEPDNLPCGHPASLLLMSAETGEALYCELCDDKSGRRDAEQCETELRAEVERLKTALKTVGDDYPGSSCQQWCYEAAGIRAPAGCNHFPGQVNCEWCTEPERATQPVEPKP